MYWSKVQPNASFISEYDQCGTWISSYLPARDSVSPFCIRSREDPLRRTLILFFNRVSSSQYFFTVSLQPVIFWVSSITMRTSLEPDFNISLALSQSPEIKELL